MQTVPLAIERGTTGLNWSFDGITSPTQRLFLSAMAGELGSPTAKPVPMTAIEHILRSRQIGVDRVELARAPQELEQWNIIIKSDDGFRFAVPMIGLWIRKERPLEQLMSEARFSNPQAYQYYELASQAHKKGDLDRAILDYRGAVNANPVFLEAYKGLAEALIRSKGADGLDEAIEINERILEIDPNESPVTLLDLLSRRLDEPATVDLQLKRFDRIGQLEPDGHMFSRARRQLEQIAFSLMDQHAYDEAGQVFHKLDDAYMVQKARSRRVRFRQLLSLWMACAALPFGTILLGLSLYPNLVIGMRAGVAFVGGSALSVVMSNMQFPRKAPVVGARQSTQVRQEAVGDGGRWIRKKSRNAIRLAHSRPLCCRARSACGGWLLFPRQRDRLVEAACHLCLSSLRGFVQTRDFQRTAVRSENGDKEEIEASSKVSNHDS
jgi:hypothetical protein